MIDADDDDDNEKEEEHELTEKLKLLKESYDSAKNQATQTE